MVNSQKKIRKRRFLQIFASSLWYSPWMFTPLNYTYWIWMCQNIQLQTNQLNSMWLQKHTNMKIDETNVQSLNFRPIIAQTGTCTYIAAQVISNYLKPLYTYNKYIIYNIQGFSRLIQEQSLLQEYMSYEIESLFTNVPITETIDYILAEIYLFIKLPKLCCRLIIKRLLLKLSTESINMFHSKF